MTSRPINPGHAFRADKLYRFSPPDQVQVLKAWPWLQAWRLEGGFWRAWNPDDFHLRVMEQQLQVPAPGDTEATPYKLQRAECLKQFLERIPDQVRLLVLPFRESHWRLLRATAVFGAPFMDLLQSSPALAFIIAERKRFDETRKSWPARVVRRLLSGRQRDLIGAFGFNPASEAVVRLLRRVPHECITFERLYFLRIAVQSADVRSVLSSLPKLSNEVLRVATDPTLLPIVPRDVLVALGKRKNHRPATATALAGWVQAAKAGGIGQISARDVRDLCAHPARWAELGQFETSGLEPFAPPPLAEYRERDFEIAPIVHERDILKEAVEMRHCVFSYRFRIGRPPGFEYVYRVSLGKERATLAIRLRGDRFVIDDLRGPRNRTVSEQLVAQVQSWLDRVQVAHTVRRSAWGPWWVELDPQAEMQRLVNEPPDD